MKRKRSQGGNMGLRVPECPPLACLWKGDISCRLQAFSADRMTIVLK